MSIDKKNMILVIPILVCALFLYACAYIVVPELEDGGSSIVSKGWTAVATNIGKSDSGDLRIFITIRNETGDWSTMQSVNGKPAVLTTGDGKTTNCDTIFVGTGNHRLAPGFQMRGYMTGKKAEPEIQLIYVECKGIEEITPGSKLSMDISYVTGELNYFEQEANQVNQKLEINLDQVAKDLKYPIAEPIEGLIQKPDVQIDAINNNILTLTDVQRTDTGLQFTWQNSNPSGYTLKVHIGIPPVIGEDGIIYGIFKIMDLESPPVTPAGGEVEWTTDVAVPQDVKGFYILLSVESKKQRLYVNYALDITDK